MSSVFPLAAGVWIPLLGWQLNPMFGAAAMSLSSFCVVSNALRLNWFKMYDASKDRKDQNKETKQGGDNNDKKPIKIEGMMCGHCEATVKKALEALDQVDTAEVSHEAGTAVVTLNSDVSDDVLKKTVEDKDYESSGNRINTISGFIPDLKIAGRPQPRSARYFLTGNSYKNHIVSRISLYFSCIFFLIISKAGIYFRRIISTRRFAASPSYI